MLVLQLHRWTGLTIGLVLVFIAVTGALISYRWQLEPLVNADLLTVPACSDRAALDALAENARAAHPAGELDYIRIVQGEPGASRIPATQIRVSGPQFQDDVFLNPCTAKVLGQRGRYGGFLGRVEQLHRFRFMEGGSLITGTVALFLAIVLIGGGIYMWWPRGLRTLRSSVGFDPRLSPGARTLDRHRIVGLYASCIVLASALTGLPQAFDWYRKGIYVVTGSPQPDQKPRSTPAADAHRLPMETYWQRTQLLVPRQREALLHFPSRPRDPVEIFVIADDAPHANARTMIFLDAYRGSVLRYTPYSQSSLGNRVYFWTLSWHTGEIGGPVGPLVLLFGALSIPFLAYSGTASYVRRRLKARAADARLTVMVTRKTLEAADICSFELMDPSGKSLPAFTAGSHIDVHLRDGLVRQYSLCSDPRDRHRYLIGVLRAAGSRGGSDALHDYVREGDVIEISRPKNYFPLAPAADRSLLLAGGIGITPLICMAEQLAGSGATFEMHYSARSVERAAFLARLRRSPFANRVSFHFSNDPLSAHLDIATVLQHPDPGTHIYVCGPQGFMDAVLAMAARQGWPEHCLHREYFAADTRSGKNDTEFDVRIASTGKICRVAKDETVVAALSRCGIRVPTSCTQGVCGMCLTRVIEGDPDHRDLFQSAAERMRNDQFTPCCSRANSALLVLDL